MKTKCLQKTAGRPAKIDVGEALKLRLHNKLSYGQIAKLLGVTKQSIEARLSKFMRLLENHEIIDEFENNRGNILSSAELELLYHLLDPTKLDRAGLSEVSKAFATVAQQGRLSRGESTQNYGVAIRIEDIVTLKEKRIKEIRERGVPEHQIEKTFAEECAKAVEKNQYSDCVMPQIL